MKGLVSAGLGSDLMDTSDIVRRNDVLNVEKELSKVKAKVLLQTGHTPVSIASNRCIDVTGFTADTQLR